MNAALEIPGYEFQQRIGVGGMAEVWLARQAKLDRMVAIKVLSFQIDQDSTSYERFIYEARAAASMIHPNIVQVIDAGEISGIAYFVMEYVPGLTAGERLKKEGALPEEDALTIAIEVAEALHYGWAEHHTVHCDIKPDNLLLHRNGRTKVADLGLAQVIGSDMVPIEDGMTIGTPNYFAPEQALVEDNLDCRTDIYALGATLYHMVTGVLPFKGLSPDDVADQQVNGHLADPYDENPAVSVPLCYLLEKMMSKHPDDRQRDWQEVITDLKTVRDGHMISAPLDADGLSTILNSPNRPEPSKIMVSVTNHRIPSTIDYQPVKHQDSSIGAFAILLTLIAIGLYAYTFLYPNH